MKGSPAGVLVFSRGGGEAKAFAAADPGETTSPIVAGESPATVSYDYRACARVDSVCGCGLFGALAHGRTGQKSPRKPEWLGARHFRLAFDQTLRGARPFLRSKPCQPNEGLRPAINKAGSRRVWGRRPGQRILRRTRGQEEEEVVSGQWSVVGAWSSSFSLLLASNL